MKKKLVFLFVAFLCFLNGCSSKSKISNNVVGNQDPPIITKKERSSNTLLGIPEDTSYENIILKSDSNKYNINSEYITCTLTNNNIGKGFYYYSIPYIEKKSGDEWIRILNDTIEANQYSWFFCGIENNKTQPNSCSLKVFLSNLKPSVNVGLYRFVVFTAETTLYSEFEIVK